ncbi:hypothetical protein E3N88_45529 [Mikania micrantha]|uniref:SF4 helicase domain-containing protein n=1 Tax=Mikania micrantha TaxID=192012 RepID=A0A5N6L8V9_9ASTR|nr:hypothetical protein E3N88_45529 [Mikania micrantha]
MLRRHRKPLFVSNAVMASKFFIHFKSAPSSVAYSNHKSNIYPDKYFISFRIPSNLYPKLLPLSLKPSDSSFSTHASIPRPVSEVYLEKVGDKITDMPQLKQLRSKLEEIGLACGHCLPGQTYRFVCPMCKGGESNEKSLSLLIAQDGNAALWNCFRAKCGWSGNTRASADVKSSYNRMNIITPKVKTIRGITVQELKLEPLCHDLREYFAERMISEETLQRNSVMQRRYENQTAIAFTYKRKGELVSCKYRGLAKKFWQESDTEKILYGLDDIEGASDIIIVEGEMDKLAMEEAVSGTVFQSFEYNITIGMLQASRIILATDGDLPGQALAEELARRLGRERCWRVTWPSKNQNEHFKDANEVLMFMGPAVLREVIESAELYPIKGLLNFRDYFSEIDAYYHQTFNFDIGISTGWKALDDLYNVVPGELTVVTGVPNSGKVREHARKLLEKHLQKPFFDVRYGKNVEKMSLEELEAGKQWLTDSFHLIRCENDSLPSVKWVLDLAKAAVLRYGVNGLVIDPYNELDHQRPSNHTETEYVSHMLTSIKRFAQHHSCHVWFVAHPRQLQQWNGKPPNLYDISGSAHFINKCDNGIVIHRNRDPDAGAMDLVQVCVRKVRNKVSGTIGDAFLEYNRYDASTFLAFYI